ncbi:hypothetical protein WUBG_17488, partial [Wuchereria bancrofti]
MGAVINAHTGELTQIQTVVHVDTFILPLNSVIPSIENHLSMQSRNLNGTILQTQLTVAYSMQCKGGLIGRNCDLICNEAVTNTTIAVCQSNITNFSYTCTYMKNGQVQNCLPCSWGIVQESYCQNSNEGILTLSATSAIDVFVHHMGAVINAHTGELTQIQTVVHVDTFILPLNSVIPSIENHLSMQSRNLNGTILQTQLTVAYSMQCKGGLIGRNCDLICNEAVTNTTIA